MNFKKGIILGFSVLTLTFIGFSTKNVEAYGGGLEQAYLPSTTHGTWQYKISSNRFLRVYITHKTYAFFDDAWSKGHKNKYLKMRVSKYKHTRKYTYYLYHVNGENLKLKYANRHLYLTEGAGPHSTMKLDHIHK